MTLADFTWQFALEGDTFTFGSGTDLEILQIDGLDDVDVRTSTRPIPRGDGAIPGDHYLGGREPVFVCEAMGTQSGLEQLREQWAAGLPPSTDTEGTLTFSRPGTTERFYYARVLSRRWPTDADNIGLASEPRVAFEVADPRAYSTDVHSAVLEPFTTGGGLDYPITDYPKDFTVTGNQVAAANGGNAPTPPTIRFYGPSTGTCSGVQLINETTGVTLDVQTSIVAGQVLTVDMRAFAAATGGSVIDLDGADRYGSWQQTRTALLLAAGSNLLRFEADGTTTDMEAVITWRDAWT